ncbi:hypothetical protein ScPMuIL_004254 [Solemya velum]
MATPCENFAGWLEGKLKSVDAEIDTDVLVSYLIGILEEEDLSNEERKESISEFLGEIPESDREALCDDVIEKWGARSEQENVSAGGDGASVDLLSEVLVKQSLEAPSVRGRELTAEEKAQKEAVLAQFRNMNDGELPDEDDPGGLGGEDGYMAKNTNKDDVVKKQRDMREKSKQESAAKKEKNKQDREKQKQKQQERKDTEKKRTQKGERKR